MAKLYTGNDLTLEEIQDTLQQMKNSKAAGSDQINTEILKREDPMLESGMLRS